MVISGNLLYDGLKSHLNMNKDHSSDVKLSDIGGVKGQVVCTFGFLSCSCTLSPSSHLSMVHSLSPSQ